MVLQIRFQIRIPLCGHFYLPTKTSLVLVGLWLVKLKKWFVLSVLPFGLASAPYVFTKIQKVSVKHCREQGIRIFTYLPDDEAASRRLREGITDSGFVAHPEQCCWESTQVGELLGFILIVRREGIIKVPLRRIERLRNTVDLVERHKSLVTAC